jgi:hypothetical protein
VDDEGLLERQADLQREAEAFVRERGWSSCSAAPAACFGWAAR